MDKRPRTFGDIFGQSVVKELRLIAASDSPPSAILLSGPTGVGKTSAAYVLARALTCEHPLPDGNPCNECENCKDSLQERWSKDLVVLDSAKLAKDDLIELDEFAQYMPLHSRRKVMVVEEIQELTTKNRNTFLKLLEAKHPHVVMIFTTMDAPKLGTAITSRCRHYKFRQPGPGQVAEFLVNHIETETDPALIEVFNGIPDEFFTQPIFALAEVSEGSYRQAVQYLERCVDAGIFTSAGIYEEFGASAAQQVYADLAAVLALDAKAVARVRAYATSFFYRSVRTMIDVQAWAAEGQPDDSEYQSEWFKKFLANPRAFLALLRLYMEASCRPWNEEAFMLSLYCFIEDQKIPEVRPRGVPVGVGGVGTPTMAVGQMLASAAPGVPVRVRSPH